MGSEMGVSADSKAEPVLDPVGIFYICWAIIWTLVMAAGMVFLISRRHLPILRIRGLGLSLASIVLLHLYWASVQIGYVIGPLIPGDAEFWVMGIYLPFGMALFHASNSRFLHVAKGQKKYGQRGSHWAEARPAWLASGRGMRARFRRLDYTSKVLVLVAAGMVVQMSVTIVMYLVSRKFHSAWGIPGTEIHGTEMEQKMQMGRGWEWWSSVLGQFVWAWMVAPIVLCKARSIHDTQGWRLQTMVCTVANLHAAPMWLIALYVPAMEPVNKYWLPPQWICASIWIMQVFTVLLPCWEVMRQQSLRQETLDCIAQWESNKQHTSTAKSLNSGSTFVESVMTGWKSTNGSVRTNDSDESILTMGALEYVLERNPAPLQEFAAFRDFSGENIAFLTSVAQWKSSLPVALQQGRGSKGADHSSRQLVRERYNGALGIYAQFISVRDAHFPINISSHDLKRLEAIFERSARILYGEKQSADPATPFDMDLKTGPPSSHESDAMPDFVHDRVQYWGAIADAFDETVFDDAEKSIKYLVLTNTWPKFVKGRRPSNSEQQARQQTAQLV
ncbi:hypothetical protein CDD81_7594 [Ophiocordyceps australis]|uniref:RGS domain-containing protein n=1 Tax=Ophiocordyceps australis TaxID=1399860 RepID=A0A2C5Y5E2_9HYPO|nr:hypothetical protein CDD81_7594 [Ophiocordyceps australis]